MEFLSELDVAIGMVTAIVLAILFRRGRRRERDEHELWTSTHPQVRGVVDRVKVHESFESSTTYTPVILYTLPNGRQYEIDGESTGSPPREGSEVMVAYDEAIPSTARLVQPPSWTGAPGIGDVVSFFLVAGVAAGATAFLRNLFAAFAR